MSTVFHTPYDSNTDFVPSIMDAPLQEIDGAIRFLKNVLLSCDGEVSADKNTGTISWTGSIRLLFANDNGIILENSLNAGNITIALGGYMYVDLVETNNTIVTPVAVAPEVGTSNAPTGMRRIVIAFRNSTSGEVFLANVLSKLNAGVGGASSEIVTLVDDLTAVSGQLLCTTATGYNLADNSSLETLQDVVLVTAGGTGTAQVMREGEYAYQAGGLTVGGPVYVSAQGAFTQTKPELNAKTIGWAVSATAIRLMPDTFIDISSTVSSSISFIMLTDVPTTYTNQEGKLVAVKSDGSGLEFVTPPGNMLKATYDSDNDGKVDAAENADTVPWNGVSDKPTSVSGYGITDAYTKTEVDDKTWDATKITSGTIDLARLPAGALERMVPVADETARFALTTAQVQLGDTVKQTDTELLYMVVDEANLNNSAGYQVYSAGAASAVAWSGITDKPANVTDIAAISKTGNSLKVLRVKEDETGFEVATPESGGFSPTIVSPEGTDIIKYDSDTQLWINAPEDGSIRGAVPHRHWRVILDAYNAGGAAYVYELQFRTIAGVAEQATGGVSIGNGTTANCFDNNNSTNITLVNGWTVGYSFATAKAVREVAIMSHAEYYLKSFRLQFSDDNVNWDTYTTYTNKTVGWATGTFNLFTATDESLQAKFIKMKVSSPTSGQILKHNGTDWVNAVLAPTVSLANGYDLNTLKTAGLYEGMLLTNKPSGFSTYWVVEVTVTSGGRVIQRAYGYDDKPAFWIRGFDGSAWTNWKTQDVQMVGSQDANTLTWQSNINGMTALVYNIPSGGGSYFQMAVRVTPDNHTHQTIYFPDTGRIFSRGYNGSTWTAWKEIMMSGNEPYIISGWCGDYVLTASQKLLKHHVPVTCSLPINLTGSIATLETAATAETVIDIQKNGTSIGSITFAAAGTAGTFTFASAVSFVATDIVTLIAPATADATAAGFSCSLLGVR